MTETAFRDALTEIRLLCEYVAESPNGWCGDACDFAPQVLAIFNRHAIPALPALPAPCATGEQLFDLTGRVYWDHVAQAVVER